MFILTFEPYVTYKNCLYLFSCLLVEDEIEVSILCSDARVYVELDPVGIEDMVRDSLLKVYRRNARKPYGGDLLIDLEG